MGLRNWIRRLAPDHSEILQTLRDGFDGLNYQNEQTRALLTATQGSAVAPLGVLRPGASGSLTKFLVSSAAFENLKLFDVGASGGLHPMWDAFGSKLTAYGFDPIVEEVERLNATRFFGSRTFVAGLVSGPEKVPAEAHLQTLDVWSKSSATSALKANNLTMAEVFNAYKEPTFSDERFTLDEFGAGRDVEPNFLKVDTDGEDFNVLRGADRLVSSPEFLGAMIETQLHGGLDPKANTFANIDVFMRQRGLQLYKFPTFCYSRVDLPGRFRHSFPSQTPYGQIMWGDATYLRPPSDDMSPPTLLKLAALFDLFELPDCAAEIFNLYRDRLSPLVDCDGALNILAGQVSEGTSYKDYVARFREKQSDFYGND